MISQHTGTAIAQPTVYEVRASLERLLGEEFDDVWTGVCAEARVAPDAVNASEQSFDTLLDALCARGSVSRVIAMSWKIRRTAARKLTELGR